MADQITTSLAQAKVLVMQGMAGKAPRINADNQHWEVWDNTTEQWVDTGYSCNGTEGLDGHSPYINSSGYWVVFNDGTQQWVTTDVVARGVDGVSPTVTITEITRGHRVKITDAEHPNGQNFDVTDGFNGTNGTNGVDGHSPYIDPTTNTWWYFDDASGLWFDSHVTAVGTNGKSPYINDSGYWVFWDDSTGAWVVTNYKAAGTNGTDGHSPYIGANGHWFAWDENLAAFDDTGVAAQGPQGDDYVLTNQDKADIAAMALPTVTAADNGKFLRVVSGAWAAQAVPSAESNSFGGA